MIEADNAVLDAAYAEQHVATFFAQAVLGHAKP